MRDFLEILYFLSGPALVFLAWRALEQVREIRRQTMQSDAQYRDQTRREANRLAADLGERYMNEVEPLMGLFMAPLAALKAMRPAVWENGPYFDWASAPLEGDDRWQYPIQVESQIDADRAAVLLNRIEGMSLLFNKGLASDDIGRSLLGDVLVSHLQLIWPLIAMGRSESAEPYRELITLYGRWSRPA